MDTPIPTPQTSSTVVSGTSLQKNKCVKKIESWDNAPPVYPPPKTPLFGELLPLVCLFLLFMGMLIGNPQERWGWLVAPTAVVVAFVITIVPKTPLPQLP